MEGAPVAAQLTAGVDPGSSVRTRTELQDLAESYQQLLQSPAYSDRIKEAARADLERVRHRLEYGDFELGDRIVLSVAGEAELPDTLSVESGPMVTVPGFGDVPLDGVLRSEVEAHLTEALSRYIRSPNVRAEALMRLSVQGAVGRPGFYVVPAQMLLSETLMVAGGPTGSSNLDGLRIERGSQVVMQGSELQEAVRRGFTLDQLNLQAGDQVHVPAETPGGFFTNVGLVVGIISSVAFVVFQVAN